MLESDDPLRTPVRFLGGVGPARADLLSRLGIATVEDLLWHLPREVLDLTRVSPPRNLREKTVQSVRGEVVDLDARLTSGGRHLTVCLIDCGGGEYVRGVWFNQPYMLRKLQLGQQLLFSGKPRRQQGRWEFAHPLVQWLDEDDQTSTAGILPRYGLTEGLQQYEVRRIMQQAVERFAPLVADPLPDFYRERLDLPRLSEALRQVHLPTSLEEYQQGRQRILFDDLFEFQLGIALRRRAWRVVGEAPVIDVTTKIDARIRRLFPFPFTSGQDQAIREIAADLRQTVPMHRLLQADVGAGKTVVAVHAMLSAVANGYQSALMVPTEVLAMQHWETIDTLLSASRVERALITGRLSERRKAEIQSGLKSGSIQLVVGTQALIQEQVTFARLGVAVIDEQHKFGVGQRATFAAGARPPHVLVMTATPIPRSLCLTQFGDLDLTTISELPPGRQRVVTSLLSGAPPQRKAWDFVRQQLRAGRQAYIVCPRIGEMLSQEADASFLEEEPEPWQPQDDVDREAAPCAADSSTARLLPGTLRGAGAEAVYERLQETELADFRIGLVHGRLDASRRQSVMEAFRQGELQALVATTIIEVGIDVPNATLMIILDAERFGLSQLHQLRGRIARGKHQGYCFLFTETDAAEGRARLGILEQTADGFQVAERDFELRGPGDALGTRQHGGSPLRVADLRRDRELVLQTREAALDLVGSGAFDEPEFAALKRRVLDRFGTIMDLPAGG